ncbi:serine/arginine-rich splicing factor 2-like [Helianthus annuus]|uniref:serine/arginine-rich splicing factor 2-like n=1 Tax=Helianthus annuus TaxID=4232 RepID=UPI000B8F1F88|nr:serine/arginine-rich splicing factor 2-like [Helianthus annuus]
MGLQKGSQRLWVAFQHYGSIRDVFVPCKRDGGGNAFGFVRFSDVDDVRSWEEMLSGMVLDGARIRVNAARFPEYGQKTDSGSSHKEKPAQVGDVHKSPKEGFGTRGRGLGTEQ